MESESAEERKEKRERKRGEKERRGKERERLGKEKRREEGEGEGERERVERVCYEMSMDVSRKVLHDAHTKGFLVCSLMDIERTSASLRSTFSFLNSSPNLWITSSQIGGFRSHYSIRNNFDFPLLRATGISYFGRKEIEVKLTCTLHLHARSLEVTDSFGADAHIGGVTSSFVDAFRFMLKKNQEKKKEKGKREEKEKGRKERGRRSRNESKIERKEEEEKRARSEEGGEEKEKVEREEEEKRRRRGERDRDSEGHYIEIEDALTLPHESFTLLFPTSLSLPLSPSLSPSSSFSYLSPQGNPDRLLSHLPLLSPSSSPIPCVLSLARETVHTHNEVCVVCVCVYVCVCVFLICLCAGKRRRE